MSKKDLFSEQAPEGLSASILKRAEPHLEQLREKSAERKPWFWLSAAGLAAGGLAVVLFTTRSGNEAAPGAPGNSLAQVDMEMMQELEVLRDLEVLRNAKLMDEVSAWKKKRS